MIFFLILEAPGKLTANGVVSSPTRWGVSRGRMGEDPTPSGRWARKPYLGLHPAWQLGRWTLLRTVCSRCPAESPGPPIARFGHLGRAGVSGGRFTPGSLA